VEKNSPEGSLIEQGHALEKFPRRQGVSPASAPDDKATDSPSDQIAPD
jgi:hypothetical protein